MNGQVVRMRKVQGLEIFASIRLGTVGGREHNNDDYFDDALRRV
jgi:hypothetical protein